MSRILDAAGRPYGESVRDSEYDGIVRYLSHGGASLPGKQLLPDEAQSYIDAGQTLVSNWETYANRMNEGFAAGVQDAREAWYWHKNCGGPDNATIYFSADWDASEAQQHAINDYLQACIDYLGVQSVGVYGGYHVVKRVHEWNPDIKLWQTKAWSGGMEYEHIHLLQEIGYVWVGGVQCDVNEVRQDDYGQWNLHLQEGDVIPVAVSLVDGKEYTTDEMLAFIDYHAWRADKLATAVASKDGVKTDDESLKKLDEKVSTDTTHNDEKESAPTSG